MNLFRYGSPFGRRDSIYSLAAAAIGPLRRHLSFLDRRYHRVNVLVERRA